MEKAKCKGGGGNAKTNIRTKRVEQQFIYAWVGPSFMREKNNILYKKSALIMSYNYGYYYFLTEKKHTEEVLVKATR